MSDDITTRRDVLAALVAGTGLVAGCGGGTGTGATPTGGSTATSTGTGTRTATPGGTPTATPGGLELAVPAAGAAGDPLAIRVSGLDDGDRVTVEFSATDDRPVAFSGRVVATAEDGSLRITGMEGERERRLDRHTGEPLARDTDAGIEMPLARLTPGSEARPPTFVANRTVDLELVATDDAGRRVDATTTRRVVHPDLEERFVDSEDLVGTLYLPPEGDGLPGVVAFHGSAGRRTTDLARRLATQGYAVLALQYFGATGLPDSLSGIDVSYFDRAVEWLQARERVRSDRIGTVGVSRGVEAALLTAARFDGPAAAVGYSGSGFLHVGLDGQLDPVEGEGSAWVEDGEPLAGPEAVASMSAAIDRALDQDCYDTDCAIRFIEQEATTALEEARIPVERIRGPVLLCTGADDHLWYAGANSEFAIRRLDRRGHEFPYEHRSYAGAGHVIHLPYWNYSGRLTADTLGGSPAANARAANDAWPVALAYLRAGLRERDSI